MIELTNEQKNELKLAHIERIKLCEKINKLKKQLEPLNEKILSLLPEPVKMEGTISTKVDGYLYSATYKLNRKLDQKKINQDFHKMPKFLVNCFKKTFKLSIKDYRL